MSDVELLSATALAEEFARDPLAAIIQYENEPLQIVGTVLGRTWIGADRGGYVVLLRGSDTGGSCRIECYFAWTPHGYEIGDIEKGQEVTLKGRVTGTRGANPMDILFEECVLEGKRDTRNFFQKLFT